MKFVKAKKSKDKECVVTMEVTESSVTLNIDDKNVFNLTTNGDYIIWNKESIGHVADGNIPDLEEP